MGWKKKKFDLVKVRQAKDTKETNDEEFRVENEENNLGEIITLMLPKDKVERKAKVSPKNK